MDIWIYFVHLYYELFSSIEIERKEIIFWINSRDCTHGLRPKFYLTSLDKSRLGIEEPCVFLIVQKLYNMKKRKLTANTIFRIGDLYLFHPNNPRCPAKTSLWGFHNKTSKGVIYLEHSTEDLRHFRLWHSLPQCYRYYRLATGDELRDYMYNLGAWNSVTSVVFSDGYIRLWQSFYFVCSIRYVRVTLFLDLYLQLLNNCLYLVSEFLDNHRMSIDTAYYALMKNTQFALCGEYSDSFWFEGQGYALWATIQFMMPFIEHPLKRFLICMA